jgi:hypothetical protein
MWDFLNHIIHHVSPYVYTCLKTLNLNRTFVRYHDRTKVVLDYKGLVQSNIVLFYSSHQSSINP